MAILKGFSLLAGFSGRIGNQVVLRSCGSRTIMAAFPAERKNPLSEKQKAHQEKFRAAVEYVQRVRNNPELLAAYVRVTPKGKFVHNIIMADYFKNFKDNESKSPDYRCPLFKLV